MPRSLAQLLWLALLAALLSACGGSDGGGGTPSPSGTGAAPSDALTLPFPETHSTFASLPPGYRIETVLDGLDFPTSIAALPDGRLLITEQTAGRVRVVQDGRLLDTPWLEIPVSYAENAFIQELGLVSIAADPRFAENGYVYLYYTEERAPGERHTVFARARDVDGRAADLTVLLTIEIATQRTHVAGGIAFDGPDAILLGVGDHEDASSAQDRGAITGKILRLDREGRALPDNPFVGTPDADERIYAYGMRNPFGLAVDQETGRRYFTDNRDVAGDALYELEAGANYGWPDQRVALREPLAIYQQPKGMAAAIVYQGDVLPEFDNDVLFCSFHEGGMLHWSDPSELEGFEVYRRDQMIAPGCNTGVAEGADGFVYYLDYGSGRLLRISR